MKQGYLVGGGCAVFGLGLALYAALHSSSCGSRPTLAQAKGPETDPNALGPNDESLAPILRTSTQLGTLLDKAATLRLQVLISAPTEEGSGVPGLRRNGYRVDAEYFYPASAIKICTAVAALEKLGTLRGDAGGPGPDTALRIFATSGAPPQERDGSNLDGGRMTIGHEVKKALIVSNNESFNRLLDFVGYDELQERMQRDGFASVQVKHYLGAVPGAAGDAKQSPRMQLLVNDAPLEIPAREATKTFPPSTVPGLAVGSSYLDEKGQKVSGPMSFAEKNRVSIRDLQDMLISIVKPELLPARRVQLQADERTFLLKVLGTPPSESKNPVYDTDSQPDGLHRPLLVAVRKALPGHRIRSYEKNGQAYAFVTQNVYLVDETTNRSVFVAAAAYVNGNGTMNQEQYRYDDVTQPLFDGLAEVIAKSYLN